MDLETTAICIGMIVGSAVLLFVIAKQGTKSKSYEEVVAENRRIAAERGLFSDSSKQKKQQQQQTKKNKKAGKKVKEKQSKEQAVTSNSEIDSDVLVDSGADEDSYNNHHHHAKGHVEFVEPAEVPPPVEVIPKALKTKAKKAKDSKVKPILINKDDPSCISDVSTPPSPTFSQPINHFEQIHPKDEFELLHSGEKDKHDHHSAEGKSGKSVKSQKNNSKQKDNQESVNSHPKEQPKGKSQLNVDKVDSPVQSEQEVAISSSVVASQPANLTTDKLLKQAYPLESIAPGQVNGHPPPSQGKGRKKKTENTIQQLTMGGDGVNVNLLVQLLNEASMSRSEVQILTDCLLNKQNGPIPEISEWSEGPKDPMQRIKKQLAEKEKALTEKEEAYQAVNAKLKELRTSLNAERVRNSQLNQLSQDAANAHHTELNLLQIRIQRSMEETTALRDQLQHVQSSEANFESQKSQMEMHIQALSESKASLTAAVGTLQSELAELRNSHTSVSNDFHTVHNELLSSQHMVTELTRQLEEANRFRNQLEVKMHNSEQYAKQELAQANDRLKMLSEAQAEIQRLNSTNTHSQKQIHLVEKKQEEINKQNQELMGELNKLNLERNELLQTVAQLKEQIASQPTPNGTATPTDKNVNDEKAILAACKEVEAKYTQQIDLLQRQLDQHKDKNNDLRTRNWKVMEALQAAEKKLQQNDSSKTKTVDQNTHNDAILKVSQEEQKNTKDILQRLFPQISVQSTSHREWLDKFVVSANEELSKSASLAVQAVEAAPTQKQDDDVRLQELEKQNVHLQALVDKYKQVIDDTEGVLSRLQNNVTAEEQRWEKQLLEKQHELDYVKQHTISQLQSKIDTLQKTLDEHNNELSLTDKSVHVPRVGKDRILGMGDVEKLVEENSRLNALVEKLQSGQSLNGPSQDGSAEK